MRISTSTVLAAGLLVSVGSAASAGGFIAPVVDTAPVVAVEPTIAVSPWGGFYAGAGLGYAFGADDVAGVERPTGGPVTRVGELDINGVTGSLQAGYRWQTSLRGRQIVFGPEISYEGGSVDDSFDNSFGEGSSEMNNMLALRMKTGVVSNSGDMLYYGILGAGRGEFDYSIQAAGMDYEGSFKDNAFIVGLGAERKVSDRMSVFGEWEFRQFGKTELTDGAGYITEATPEHHHVKVGVNFNF